MRDTWNGTLLGNNTYACRHPSWAFVQAMHAAMKLLPKWLSLSFASIGLRWNIIHLQIMHGLTSILEFLIGHYKIVPAK